MSPIPSRGLPQFFALADVAELLNVDLAVVVDLVKSNELTAVRIGETGAVRIARKDLEHFLTDRYDANHQETIFSQAEFVDIPEITGSGTWRAGRVH